MRVIERVEDMKAAASGMRESGDVIGFVPTMGFLHEGHLSLVRASRKACDRTVVSIFVNPAQFAPHEDFDDYPRDTERDLDMLRREGIDTVFIPSSQEIYPPGHRTVVEVTELQDRLCGISRPHFFRGVCTVVLKLFNIVRPHRAFFGQKDAQQAIILRRMSSDLHLDLDIRIRPVVRDENGLALSSRNTYLTPEQMPYALSLSRSLRRAREMIESGEKDAGRIRAEMESIIRAGGDTRIDYTAIVDPRTLDALDEVTGEALIAAAVFVGKVRLIDNTWIGIEQDSLKKTGGGVRPSRIRSGK